jgi:hypothetical protein
MHKNVIDNGPRNDLRISLSLFQHGGCIKKLYIYAPLFLRWITIQSNVSEGRTNHGE